MSEPSLHEQRLAAFFANPRGPNENAAANEIENLRAEIKALKAKAAKPAKPAAKKKAPVKKK
jgi:hypothetical protein